MAAQANAAQQEQADTHRETEAYKALVSDGGRPSYPLDLLRSVVGAPGEHRDILRFWQDHPDQWQVFSKQLRRWQEFRKHQRNKRVTPEAFTDHVGDVDVRLARHGLVFPPLFGSASAALNINPSQQDGLATWIEYLHFEYRTADKYETIMNGQQGHYGKAWNKLLASGVLEPDERSPNMMASVCEPSLGDVALRMFERRRYNDSASYDNKDDEVWGKIKRIDKRTDCIVEFKESSEKYRSAEGAAHRQKALLNWARGQLDLIQEGMADTAKPGAGEPASSVPSCNFDRFTQLPVEIRQMIWLECLPIHPTAHSFEVLNRPLEPHLNRSWSSREFRVCATPKYSSGYHDVYPLLAACREARHFVADHYSRIRRAANQGRDYWEPEEPLGSFGNFETFDWIPADDLVVLHFPPRQARLPPQHALTFARGLTRHVGIFIPKEFLLVEAWGADYDGGRVRPQEPPQVRVPFLRAAEASFPISQIPEFLQALIHEGRLEQEEEPANRRGRKPKSKKNNTGSGASSAVGGGVEMIHVIVEGLHASRKGRLLEWRTETARPSETCHPWGHRDGTYNLPYPPRIEWQLGTSSRHVTLAEVIPKDNVERAPAARIRGIAAKIRKGCEVYGGSPEIGVLGKVLEK